MSTEHKADHLIAIPSYQHDRRQRPCYCHSHHASKAKPTLLFASRKQKRRRNQASTMAAGSTKDSIVKATETPPDDDVCPICFGDFTLACRSDCGHWFCGSCILQVWNHGSAFHPCKCPMCCRHIKNLTPEASVYCPNEEDAKTILKTVGKYNHLFVGGTRGFILKIRELPLLIGRMVREMTDPDQADSHILKWRLFAMMVGFIYMISPFDFIPPGVDILHLCNCSAVLLVGLLKLVGLYRARQAALWARQIGAAEPLVWL